MQSLIELIRSRFQEPGPMEKLIKSWSGYVLAIPDLSYLSQMVAYDEALRGKRSILSIGPKPTSRLLDYLEKDGTFIPNNFSLLGKAIYPPLLRIREIPIPPFEILNRNKNLSEEQIDNLVAAGPASRPRLFIVKVTESHRGEGIRIITDEELTTLGSSTSDLMVQAFCWPANEVGYVRDGRVVTIDGEPVAMALREAKDQLVDSVGNLIENPPALSRVLANIIQGGKVVKVQPGLQEQYFGLARETCQQVAQFAAGVRQLIFQARNPEEVNLGLMAVDILQGEDGLFVNEVDTYPDLHFFPASKFRAIANGYANYLRKASESKNKPILVIDLERLFGRDLGLRMPIEPKVLMEIFAANQVPFAMPVIRK